MVKIPFEKLIKGERNTVGGKLIEDVKCIIHSGISIAARGFFQTFLKKFLKVRFYPLKKGEKYAIL